MKREYKAGLMGAAVGGAAASPAAAVTAGEVKVHAFQAAVPRGVLATATYTFADFGVAEAGRRTGALLPATGLTGQGVTSSILRMTDHSSTRASAVPTAPETTNPLDLITVTGA